MFMITQLRAWWRRRHPAPPLVCEQTYPRHCFHHVGYETRPIAGSACRHPVEQQKSRCCRCGTETFGFPGYCYE